VSGLRSYVREAINEAIIDHQRENTGFPSLENGTT